MKRTNTSVLIIAVLLAFASINTTAKDFDIKKIAGISLGDSYEDVCDWVEENNLDLIWEEGNTNIIAEDNITIDGTTEKYINIPSLPANYYHFQFAYIFFDEKNRVERINLFVDSKYSYHPKSLRKLLDTLKNQSNSFDYLESVHYLVMNFDNCEVGINTELNSSFPQFYLIIQSNIKRLKTNIY
ncbi:MAG: hypothetical protein ABFD00_02215 [Chloroherpetonaceae bacterium]